jgi:hypothetical protein
MLEAAERSAVDGSGISWSFIAIACAALGQPEEARAALNRWASIDPEAYGDPAAEYRMHGGTEDTVNALLAGLRKAGWTKPSGATNEQRGMPAGDGACRRTPSPSARQ